MAGTEMDITAPPVVAELEVPPPNPALVVGELFDLKCILSLDPSNRDEIKMQAKFSISHLNYFAVVFKHSGSLLVLCDVTSRNGLVGSDDGLNRNKTWKIKHIPWFEEPAKKISAISFDEEGVLYIGTHEGTIFELSAPLIFNSSSSVETDLRQIFHLEDFLIADILIWFRDNTKIILCDGGDGKFIVVPTNSLPILVTFNSPIAGMDIYTSNAGLSCALICLQNDQNLTTILDDLDILPQEESAVKKSIFDRAREKIISKFGDADRGNIFGGRRNSKDKDAPQNTSVNSAERVLPASTTGPSHQNNATVSVKPPQITNLRFTTVEELHSRGPMRKIIGKNQFFRHLGNKLDIFEADFRQIAAMYLPISITKLFIIQNIFYGIDEEGLCIRMSLVHNGMLKEFAIIPFTSKILSIQPVGEVGGPRHAVFVVSQNGIFEIALKNSPIETCVELLKRDLAGTLLDVVCNAWNVIKTDVYILAGDKSASEGKFAKTIIYYKVAGMSYSKIVAKFGSCGMIPAMLCFFDLVDQEKAKFAGNVQEKYIMADIVLSGRIEQYLRHGTRNESPRNPMKLLETFLTRSIYYTSRAAAYSLTYPELLWAAQTVGKMRLCYSEILLGMYINRNSFQTSDHNALFWKLLSVDWVAIYTAPSSVFFWFRDLIKSNMDALDASVISNLCQSLLPWRRELLRKIFSEASDSTEIIDFTVTPETNRVKTEDYIELFIHVMLETLKRGNVPVRLPVLFYKWQGLDYIANEISSQSGNPVASQLLSTSYSKTFSASSVHCLCVRNGRVFAWGDNSGGRLGIPEDRDKSFGPVDTPTAINLSPGLRIVIEAVSCGQTHNMALTNVGTILLWGSNSHGQLGIGSTCSWSGRPVFPNLPHVIFTCIAAGSYHSVAVDHKNRAWTWGWGVWGQLGNDGIENRYHPAIVKTSEKIVSCSAGHSHTALVTITGKALTFGCAHFGQLGQGLPNVKVKVPTPVTLLPPVVVVKAVECGVCSTTFITMKGRIFYAGLNPASLRSMISGPRRRGDSRNAPPAEPEEKDYYAPVLIESTHLAGDISKLNVGTTHMAVLTTLGLIYTWGMGKSGQLIRPDDDSKSLELVDTDDKVIVASDVVCAGDCSWLVEKESGKVYGCGFNSNGQLGKMETEQDQSVMTFKTKKRVVKVRQPANIYFRPREIAGMPRRSSIVEIENGVVGRAELSPPSDTVNQNLLEWALTVFQRNYRPRHVVSLCLKYGNNEAAALVETLVNDHEAALQHRLADAKNQNNAAAIEDYVDKKKAGGNCFEQAYRFVAIVIQHWKENSLPNANLEAILETYRKIAPWDAYISRAIKEMLSVSDDRAKWIAESFTPSFILNCIRDSKRPVVGDYTGTINAINETAVNQSGDSDFTAYKTNGISSRLSIEEKEIDSQ